MRKFSTSLIILLSVLTLSLITIPSHSTQTIVVRSCDEAGLNAAIAAGGDNAFDCISPTTISITQTKTVSLDLTLDGGDLLTISGNHQYEILFVNNGVSLNLKHIVLTDGGRGITNNGGTVTIQYSTISNNYSDYNYGGGINNANQGTVSVENSIISGNSADLDGGGIYNDGTHGESTVTITNSIIANNTVSSFGGGLYNDGTMTIIGSTVSGNSAGVAGGGIRNNYGQSLTISNSVLSNNLTNGNGGGIWNYGVATVEYSTIFGNAAGKGGGIYTHQNAITSISDTTIMGNWIDSSGGQGGGVFNSNGSVLNLINTTINGNTISDQGEGGGIFNDWNGTINLANTTISDNSVGSGGVGGGIYATSSPVNISNSTISGNSVGSGGVGGGIYNGNATIVMQDTIVTNSGGTDCYNDGAYSGTYSGSSNLSDDGTCPGTIDPVSNFSVALSNNGGTTWTHALLFNSNAIDTATSCSFLSSGTNPLFNHGDPIMVDQRGELRDANCDIGAFEFLWGSHIGLRDGTTSIMNGGWVDFGVRESIDLPLTKTFVIENQGSTVQSLIAPVDYPSGCSLVGIFPTLIDPGNSATITVECTGSSVVGEYSGQISFGTSDPDQNPFVFTIKHQTQLPDVVGAGTTSSCTNAALNVALGGGGTITFDCGGVHTITTSDTIIVSTEIVIDGNGQITISGGNHHRGFLVNSGHTLTLQNITIANGYESEQGSGGGGIWNDGGTLIVEGSTITNNEAAYQGGGIYSRAGGTVIITNSTLSYNTAVKGGAIWNDVGTVTIDDSTIVGNQSELGGGIANFASGIINISNSTISGNLARQGGGIHITGGCIANIENSTLDNNVADFGGGIYNYEGGTLNIANSTLSNNIADGISSSTGGGIWNDGLANITNVTFSGNQTIIAPGGGIWNDATMVMQNTIVTNSVHGDCDTIGGLFTGNNNLSDDGTCPGTIGAVTNFDTNLADNGGPTRTHALLPGSSAIDVVLPADCSVTTDQRGILRPQGIACDIGAFEADQAPTTTSVPCEVADLLTAITTANSTSGDDILELATGCVYTLTAVENTTNGSNGLPVIMDAAIAGTLTINGNGATIERDNGAPDFRIFHVEENGDLTLSDITIRGGRSTGTAPASYGGGIYNDGGTVTIATSAISGNSANNHGGGIYNGGTVNILSDSRIEVNVAGLNGGGVYNASNGILAVNGSNIFSNRAASWHGGGIFNEGFATITDSTLSNNAASNNHGGGIHNGGTVNIVNSTLSGNASRYEGGGIKNYGAGAVDITDSVFSANSSGSGGGIANWNSTITISNTIFSGNLAYSRGGAIYKSNGALTITNSTFSGNIVVAGSGYGGGIYSAGSGTTSVTGSCLVDNADVALYRASGLTVTATGNYWGRADGAGPVAGGSGDTVSTEVDTSGYLTSSIRGCPTLAPEIGVKDGGSANIADGGSFTFQPTIVGIPVSETFTVANTGNAFLLLSNLSLPAGFSITETFSETWGVTGAAKAGGTATFTIQCDANAGSYSGILSFDNNDGDENPFDFTINCIGSIITITEQELFDQMQTEIATNPIIQSIDFVLADFTTGRLNLTTRTEDGVVGEVVVVVMDPGTGYVVFHIDSVTVDGSSPPVAFAESINRELMVLLVSSLDALVTQKTGFTAPDLHAMTIDDTVITIGF